MTVSTENLVKFLTLILVPIIPTLLIYKGLGHLIGLSDLQGETLGYTVSFSGPAAFYIFIVLLFRKWATTSAKAPLTSIDQDDIDLMSSDEKIRLVHEISAEIAVLNKRLEYLQAIQNQSPTPDMPQIRAIQVDPRMIRG